jgi:hypothetical protein
VSGLLPIFPIIEEPWPAFVIPVSPKITKLFVNIDPSGGGVSANAMIGGVRLKIKAMTNIPIETLLNLFIT